MAKTGRPKGGPVMTTPRQRKAFEGIMEGKTAYQALIDAGYAKTVARAQARKVLNQPGVQVLAQEVVKQLEVERNRAIEAMPDKIKTAYYRDLVDAADKLTKNIQLLSGGQTERHEQQIVIMPSEMIQKHGLHKEAGTIDASAERDSTGQAQISGN